MSIEAMKQALDALEQHGTPLLNHEDVYSASLTALRQAIEAAEKQEPVVWFDSNACEGDENQVCGVQTKRHTTPLYAAPPKREWVGLTDLEIDQIYCDCHDDNGYPISLGKYERALEAKLREKNGC